MCEAGMNVKAIQAILGHVDIAITMNVYIDATTDFVQQELEKNENYLNISNVETQDENNVIIPVTVGSPQRDKNPQLVDLSCKTSGKGI